MKGGIQIMKKWKLVLVFLGIFLLLCLLSGTYIYRLAKKESHIENIPKGTEIEAREEQRELGM